MKKLNSLLLGLALAGTAQMASADVAYTPGDLLLVFRSSTGSDAYNDVVVNIGSVTNYLTMAAGTKTTVSYDSSILSTYFGGSHPKFAVVGATKTTDPVLRYWASTMNLTTTPSWPTYSAWGGPRGKIESVGNNAVTGASGTGFAYFAASPDTTLSYSWTVTGGTPYSPVNNLEVKNIGTMNGSLPFTVDNTGPTTVALYEFQPVAGQPAPLIGAFTLDYAGNMTFWSKQLPPLPATKIVSIAGTSPNRTITFGSTNGVNYDVQSATSASGPWTSLNNIVPGTGSNQAVTDNNATNALKIYRVKSKY
jgi:hypothetical protein